MTGSGVRAVKICILKISWSSRTLSDRSFLVRSPLTVTIFNISARVINLLQSSYSVTEFRSRNHRTTVGPYLDRSLGSSRIPDFQPIRELLHSHRYRDHKVETPSRVYLLVYHEMLWKELILKLTLSGAIFDFWLKNVKMLKNAVYKRSPKVIVKSISGHSLEKFVEFNEAIAIVVKNVENKATICWLQMCHFGDRCMVFSPRCFWLSTKKCCVKNLLCKWSRISSWKKLFSVFLWFIWYGIFVSMGYYTMAIIRHLAVNSH